MKIPAALLFTFSACALYACTRSATAPTASAPSNVAATATAATVPGATHFGGAMGEGPAVALDSVLAAPDSYSGKQVVVDGKVRANCTRKGCWMELASAMDPAAPGCRVTFQDYGFFVPTNSQGSSARVSGAVATRTIPAAEVAHLESEGGRFPTKLADGSAKEVRIVASGVDLWRIN